MSLNTVSNNIFTIDSFLTINEYEQFILQAEKVGFAPADVDTGISRKHLTNIRNNERVNLNSKELATDWWAKLSFIQLPEIEDKQAVGLSPHFRFYKYTAGQKFNMHKDGRQHVSGNTTMLTMLVYLNESYIGGSTKFRQDEITILPATGKALIFEHHLWHQGVALETGIKYILRTDIIYQ